MSRVPWIVDTNCDDRNSTPLIGKNRSTRVRLVYPEISTSLKRSTPISRSLHCYLFTVSLLYDDRMFYLLSVPFPLVFGSLHPPTFSVSLSKMGLRRSFLVNDCCGTEIGWLWRNLKTGHFDCIVWNTTKFGDSRTSKHTDGIFWLRISFYYV